MFVGEEVSVMLIYVDWPLKLNTKREGVCRKKRGRESKMCIDVYRCRSGFKIRPKDNYLVRNNISLVSMSYLLSYEARVELEECLFSLFSHTFGVV